MKKAVFWTLFFVACLGAVASTGCSKARIKGLVPAEGVVTFNGAPVEGATVIFAPKATVGDQSAGAQTMTDAQGKFKMTTLDPGDGVFPGDYYVTITKDTVEGTIGLDEAKRRLENPNETRDEKTPEQTLVRELPVKYADINSSGLDLTIPAEGKKDIQFALEGEVDLTPQKMNGPGH